MSAAIFSLMGNLDKLRSQILRVTLSNSTLKNMFCVRSNRLAALFVLSVALSLCTSLLAPLWVLVLGPLIYGTPHLFSSLRYVHSTAAGEANIRLPQFKKALYAFSFIFSAVSILRILSDFGFVNTQHLSSSSNLLELGSFVLSLLCCAVIYKHSYARMFVAFALCIPFVWAAWTLPLWTSGVLILLHNFIAFIYWIGATQTRRERAIAVLAAGVFLLVNAAIFSGVFDGVYKLMTPTAELPWAALEYSELGKMIAPWSSDYVTWFHAVVAYAFGQSLHYFVWLKAIPDQHHTQEVPTTFRQSYKLLVDDFGKKHYIFMLAVILISVGAWAFLKMPEARIVYFSFAAYHGYLEIAGLGFFKARSLS